MWRTENSWCINIQHQIIYYTKDATFIVSIIKESDKEFLDSFIHHFVRGEKSRL